VAWWEINETKSFCGKAFGKRIFEEVKKKKPLKLKGFLFSKWWRRRESNPLLEL